MYLTNFYQMTERFSKLTILGNLTATTIKGQLLSYAQLVNVKPEFAISFADSVNLLDTDKESDLAFEIAGNSYIITSRILVFEKAVFYTVTKNGSHITRLDFYVKGADKDTIYDCAAFRNAEPK